MSVCGLPAGSGGWGLGWGHCGGRAQESTGPWGPQAFLLMLVAQLGASVVSSVKWGEGDFSFLSPNWTLSFQAL